MKRRPAAVGTAVLLMAVLGGCAGDGTGLDEFGNPIGDSSQLEPTLASIQANILTPICTECHTGSAAPLGLALNDGVSYSVLVGVQSVERTALRRVAPGKPDSSYLVWKIEGRNGIVGGRMPLGKAPLSSQQIKAIRDWIADGALR